MPSLLLVEDDENLRVTLADNLTEQGYAVATASTVKAAQAASDQQRFDLCVLDVMLPDGDGYAFCRALRKKGATTRVLMLTARTLEDDVVKGFDSGADDYLAKPYRLKELFARLQALQRRGPVAASAARKLGPYSIDTATREVTGPEGAVALTRKEFDLLVLLLDTGDRVLTRDEILDAVWGKDVVVDAHTVDNFVSSLKKKLKGKGFELKTVRGVGFRLVQ